MNCLSLALNLMLANSWAGTYSRTCSLLNGGQRTIPQVHRTANPTRQATQGSGVTDRLATAAAKAEFASGKQIVRFATDKFLAAGPGVGGSPPHTEKELA